VQDTFLDTLQVIDFANAFSNLLTKLFDKKRGDDSRADPAIKYQTKHNQRCNNADDDNFSPCQIHISNKDSVDGWDHFADFQDRMDEELVSFTPFAANHKSKGKLDTLDEIEEEDECVDVFSF